MYGHEPPRRPVAPPPRESARRPARVEPVPDTGYGMAIYDAPPATSGPAVGGLVAGIGSVLVAFVVGCFALGGAAAATQDQSAAAGAVGGGAFTVLAGFLGLAGIGLGLAGLRQTRRVARQPAGEVRGRGMAVAGVVCGAFGALVAVCSLGVAVLVALA